MSRSTRDTFSTEAETDPFAQGGGLLARARQALLPASWTSRGRGFEPLGESERAEDPEQGPSRPGSAQSTPHPSRCR